MIKHIIFDLAEVCMQGLVGVDKQIADLTGRSEKEVYIHFRTGNKLISAFKGRLTEEEYLAAAIRDGEFNISTNTVKEIIRANFREFPETIEIIQKLKANGYPVGLLSDHMREWIGFIEGKFPFMQLFDRRIYSFDSGRTKLEALAFTNAILKMGADPDKTLMIDDNGDNILRARDAGIRYAHQFVNAPALEEYLRSQKVKLD